MNISKLIFSFEGRINREDFWIGTLLITVIPLVMFIVARISESVTALAIAAVFALLSIWPFVAVQIKRWHDRDKSGRWALINLVPAVGAVWVIVELGFLKGTEGPNRFGPDPMVGRE